MRKNFASYVVRKQIFIFVGNEDIEGNISKTILNIAKSTFITLVADKTYPIFCTLHLETKKKIILLNSYFLSWLLRDGQLYSNMH